MEKWNSTSLVSSNDIKYYFWFATYEDTTWVKVHCKIQCPELGGLVVNSVCTICLVCIFCRVLRDRIQIMRLIRNALKILIKQGISCLQFKLLFRITRVTGWSFLYYQTHLARWRQQAKDLNSHSTW